jgi:hypothetical protein
MALETSDAGAATEDHRRQSCYCCKNPTHLEPPFAAFVGCSSGGLVGDLRVYLGPIRVRNEINEP